MPAKSSVVKIMFFNVDLQEGFFFPEKKLKLSGVATEKKFELCIQMSTCPSNELTVNQPRDRVRGNSPLYLLYLGCRILLSRVRVYNAVRINSQLRNSARVTTKRASRG